jgi:hypothetical protein
MAFAYIFELRGVWVFVTDDGVSNRRFFVTWAILISFEIVEKGSLLSAGATKRLLSTSSSKKGPEEHQLARKAEAAKRHHPRKSSMLYSEPTVLEDCMGPTLGMANVPQWLQMVPVA